MPPHIIFRLLSSSCHTIPSSLCLHLPFFLPFLSFHPSLSFSPNPSSTPTSRLHLPTRLFRTPISPSIHLSSLTFHSLPLTPSSSALLTYTSLVLSIHFFSFSRPPSICPPTSLASGLSAPYQIRPVS